MNNTRGFGFVLNMTKGNHRWNPWKGRAAAVGTTFGNKDITMQLSKRLGEGGYGTVYSATLTQNRHSKTKAAIKFMQEQNDARREVFIHLAVAANPECDNAICQMYGYFTARVNNKRIPCLALELMSGDLIDFMLRTTYSTNVTKLQILLHIMYVAMHMIRNIRKLSNQGFYHQDIKPLNFLYKWEETSGRYRVKASDMGLACVRDTKMIKRIKSIPKWTSKIDVGCSEIATEGFHMPGYAGGFDVRVTDYARTIRNDLYGICVSIRVFAEISGVGTKDTPDFEHLNENIEFVNDPRQVIINDLNVPGAKDAINAIHNGVNVTEYPDVNYDNLFTPIVAVVNTLMNHMGVSLVPNL